MKDEIIKILEKYFITTQIKCDIASNEVVELLRQRIEEFSKGLDKY